MKKLFFTALAVVAFSGVSMASTVEVKQVLPTIEKVQSADLKTEQIDQCYDNAMNYLDMFGSDDDVYNEQIWQILIANC